MQSRVIDFGNKRKTILTDLLISGMCYYKVTPSASKANVNLKVLNPLNTFIDRNPESQYHKDSARSVIREYLTKDQIFVKYGDLLKKDDLAMLKEEDDVSFDEGEYSRLVAYDTENDPYGADGILGGYEVQVTSPFERVSSKNFRLYPVYEVEWLKAEKEKEEYVTNRYEGVRIGANIFIPMGKDKDVVRSMDDPKNCALRVNGMFYADRNGDPWSLMLATASLQDKFDILHFYRDNVIAESGTAGD